MIAGCDPARTISQPETAISASPAAELASAVLAALKPLIGGLSGELAARGRKYPRISVGRTTVHDWSSGAATGEQLLTVHVLTKQEGEAARLKESVRTRLGERLDQRGVDRRQRRPRVTGRRDGRGSGDPSQRDGDRRAAILRDARSTVAGGS